MNESDYRRWLKLSCHKKTNLVNAIISAFQILSNGCQATILIQSGYTGAFWNETLTKTFFFFFCFLFFPHQKLLLGKILVAPQWSQMSLHVSSVFCYVSLLQLISQELPDWWPHTELVDIHVCFLVAFVFVLCACVMWTTGLKSNGNSHFDGASLSESSGFPGWNGISAWDTMQGRTDCERPWREKGSEACCTLGEANPLWNALCMISIRSFQKKSIQGILGRGSRVFTGEHPKMHRHTILPIFMHAY